MKVSDEPHLKLESVPDVEDDLENTASAFPHKYWNEKKNWDHNLFLNTVLTLHCTLVNCKGIKRNILYSSAPCL